MTYVTLNEQVNDERSLKFLGFVSRWPALNLAICWNPLKLSVRTEHAILFYNIYVKRRENQKDGTMGNQQERFDLDLAWLTGIIEGEGRRIHSL